MVPQYSPTQTETIVQQNISTCSAKPVIGCQAVHRGGATEEDGLEGRPGSGASREEEGQQAENQKRWVTLET